MLNMVITGVSVFRYIKNYTITYRADQLAVASDQSWFFLLFMIT